MDLKKYKLGEILEVKRGASLSGEFYATEGKYIRLTCGNFDYRNNSFKENKSKDNLFYIGEFKPEFLMKEGDIITPLTEQAIGLLGSTAIVPESNKYIQSQDVAKIVCKEDLLDKNFAFYLMSSTWVKQQLSVAAQQTKIRHTSPDKIKGCTVWISELGEQKRIGKLLRTLDRKIELNRAINDNLEAMAKQLYDYWFVQFDFPDENGRPYKSSGGAMVWNEKLKREIPKGWGNCTLEYYLIIKNGRDHKHLGNGIYPVYGSGGEMRKVDSYLYFGESILMPRKGSLNNIMYVNDAFWSVDTMFYSEMKQSHCAKYVFYSIKDIDFTRWDSGTGVPSMTSSTLYSISLIKPDVGILAKFDETITPLFQTIKKNEMQIVELTKQRNELLPLLMNGQVSVNYHLATLSGLAMIYLCRGKVLERLVTLQCNQSVTTLLL